MKMLYSFRSNQKDLALLQKGTNEARHETELSSERYFFHSF